jgi:hypothetical protein
MRQASRHHPGAHASHVEKGHMLLPPRLVLRAQHGQTFAAILCIAVHERSPSFLRRQGRGLYIDTQHGVKPHILTDALMYHLLVHTPAARVDRMGPERQIRIREHAPHANDLQAFGGVGVDQKIIGHRTLPSDVCR